MAASAAPVMAMSTVRGSRSEPRIVPAVVLPPDRIASRMSAGEMGTLPTRMLSSRAAASARQASQIRREADRSFMMLFQLRMKHAEEFFQSIHQPRPGPADGVIVERQDIAVLHRCELI